MKFTYVDESGDQAQGDVFVMAGVHIDAYRLRKQTAQFDEMITKFLAKHPKAPKELKTKAFINGSGGWSAVDAIERKQFLSEICDLAAECARLFVVALSFKNFEKATNAGHQHTFGKSYWLGAAMLVAALVQRKMQEESGNKGLTVLICDDNKREMPNLSDALYEANRWNIIAGNERFNQIVNCAFAIKSHHSSLIQVADAVSYIYRRHLELKGGTAEWDGERLYFDGLVGKLEVKRVRLGRNPGGACIEFYKAARHKEWTL
jgi:hypothetical protein